MKKEEFSELFLECTRQGIEKVEKKYHISLSKNFEVELKGAGVAGAIVAPAVAIDLMFISEDLFFCVIDVGVKAVVGNKAIMFVGVSGHEP